MIHVYGLMHKQMQQLSATLTLAVAQTPELSLPLCCVPTMIDHERSIRI
jgi:hypothetical protein